LKKPSQFLLSGLGCRDVFAKVKLPKSRNNCPFVLDSAETLRKQFAGLMDAIPGGMGSRQLSRGAEQPDHVHMCIAIPPKHPVASVIGFLKGKSAIAIARLSGKERNFSGEHFQARGYAVSTVGFELEQVRQCPTFGRLITRYQQNYLQYPAVQLLSPLCPWLPERTSARTRF
jgi:hypothetical protein